MHPAPFNSIMRLCGSLYYEKQTRHYCSGWYVLSLPPLSLPCASFPATLPQISVSCLNSVAPDPLNWQMWCPDSHAAVTQWVDASGSTHRKIVLQRMPTMTPDMAVWFMTPMFPKTLTVNGKVRGWAPAGPVDLPASQKGWPRDGSPIRAA